MIKSYQVVEDQRWTTYRFDPYICTPRHRQKVANYALSTSDVALIPGDPTSKGYVQSNDPRIYRFKKKTGHELTAAFPSTVDETGCNGRNGVSGNFMTLCTACRPMYPAVPPIPTNVPTRQLRGLNSGWEKPAHRQIFREIAEAMTEGYLPGNIQVAKYSTSGYPAFENDAIVKKALFLEQLPHVDKIMDLALLGQLERLYKEHLTVIAFRMLARRQADSQKLGEDGKYHVKERLVPDEAYALTDGRRGSIKPASRFNPDDSEVPLCRVRSAYGLSHIANLLFACTFDGFNQYSFQTYPDTFKSHGALDIANHINKWSHHQAVDVKDHDFLVPWFFIEEFFDVLTTRLSTKLVEFTRMCWQAPAYCPSADLYGPPNPRWLGHPLVASDFNHRYGLPSGINHVAFFGKLGCVACYLIKWYDIGIPVLGRVREILKWQHPRGALLDTGDDAVSCFPDEATKEKFRLSLAKPQYYLTGEEPLGYQGHTMWRDTPNEGPIHVSLRPETYISNPFTRERGLDNERFSPFWARGVEAREVTFSGIPNYGLLREAWRRNFRDSLGYDYDQAVKSHPNYKKELPPGLLTARDLDVLEDPSKLHYKYAQGEIDPRIENLFTKKIELKEYFHHVQHLIKAPLTT